MFWHISAYFLCHKNNTKKVLHLVKILRNTRYHSQFVFIHLISFRWCCRLGIFDCHQYTSRPATFWPILLLSLDFILTSNTLSTKLDYFINKEGRQWKCSTIFIIAVWPIIIFFNAMTRLIWASLSSRAIHKIGSQHSSGVTFCSLWIDMQHGNTPTHHRHLIYLG